MTARIVVQLLTYKSTIVIWILLSCVSFYLHIMYIQMRYCKGWELKDLAHLSDSGIIPDYYFEIKIFCEWTGVYRRILFKSPPPPPASAHIWYCICLYTEYMRAIADFQKASTGCFLPGQWRHKRSRLNDRPTTKQIDCLLVRVITLISRGASPNLW